MNAPEKALNPGVWNLILSSMYLLLSTQVSTDPAAELWLPDIQEVVMKANKESKKALKCKSMFDKPVDSGLWY